MTKKKRQSVYLHDALCMSDNPSIFPKYAQSEAKRQLQEISDELDLYVDVHPLDENVRKQARNCLRFFQDKATSFNN